MGKVNLENGKAYKVTHKGYDGKQTTAKRIYKWDMTDGLGIHRLVFTSRIRGAVNAEYDKNNQTLTLSGKHLPASELLVPDYCIINIQEVLT